MRRRHSPTVITVIGVCALTAVVAGGIPAEGAGPPTVVAGQSAPRDFDARTGTVAPTAVQLAETSASNLSVRWNALGTPASMFNTSGYLATGLSADPVAAARAYITAHRDLLGLAPGADRQLQLVMNAPLGPGRALLF